MENDKERVSSLEEDFERLLDVAEQRGIQTAEEVFVGEYLGRKYQQHPIKNILHQAVWSLCDLKHSNFDRYFPHSLMICLDLFTSLNYILFSITCFINLIFF